MGLNGFLRAHSRALGLLVTCLSIIAVASLMDFLPKRGVDAKAVSVQERSEGFFSLKKAPEQSPPNDETVREADDVDDTTKKTKVDALFDEARKALKKKQFDQTIRILESDLSAVKSNPESYLLVGQALEGRKEYEMARDFYYAALSKNPYLSDAYWGFATTSEALGDLESALGGMRSYLHTEPDPDPERLRINQARSAIWEWEAKLGRGEWGPTKGIPPGFTQEELKRDGQGVAVKMPLAGTERPDGTSDYEIKHAQKIKIYPRP